MEPEEGNGVKRLAADADEVGPDAGIKDPLLRHQHQLAVDLEETNAWKEKSLELI